MYKKKGKIIIVGTVAGGGWDCTSLYKGMAGRVAKFQFPAWSKAFTTNFTARKALDILQL